MLLIFTFHVCRLYILIKTIQFINCLQYDEILRYNNNVYICVYGMDIILLKLLIYYLQNVISYI